MMMTITLGEALTVISIIVSAVSIIVGVRIELRNLKTTVTALGKKVAEYEDALTRMTGQMQRVIGYIDGRFGWASVERRDGT